MSLLGLRYFPLTLSAFAALIVSINVNAAEWTVSADASTEITNEKSDEETKTSVSEEESFSLSYKHEINKDLSTSIDYTFDRAYDTADREWDETTIDNELTYELTGAWWGVSAGWAQTISEYDDPDSEDTTENSYEFEAVLEPESQELPDLKYNLEVDDDTTDKSYEGVFEYKLLHEDLVFSLELQKETTTPKDDLEDRTDDRSFTTGLTYDLTVNDAWKLSLEHEHTHEQNLTNDTEGRLLDAEESMEDSLKADLEFTPYDWIDFAFSWEENWTNDLMIDEPTQYTVDFTAEVTYKPPVTEYIDPEVYYSYESSEEHGSDSDTNEITNSSGVSIDYKPFEKYTFSTSYEWELVNSYPEAESSTETRTDDISFEFDAQVFKDQISFTITKDYSYEWENGVQTTKTDDWELSVEAQFENFPNLEVKPTFSTTTEKDLQASTKDVENELEVELVYTIALGDVTEFQVDHTYTRTATFPDDGKDYISREDATDFSLKFSDFLRAMTLELAYSYEASDESEDDLPPEYGYSFESSYTWTALDLYEFELEFGHDWGTDTDATKDYGASLSFPIFHDHFQFTFEYTFETQIEGETDDSETYLIEVSGEF
ncbi:MAG: hypothetical protein C0608_09060 [Deltaproteobacteria bacterium]|nr:MAG: hypothetical protein C0608_09060 [Deltaproteobacteria bacterium]